MLLHTGASAIAGDMARTPYLLPAIAMALFMTACAGEGGNADMPGQADDDRPFAEIAPGETIHLTGTEPFWGGEIAGRTMTYRTPEHQDGLIVEVDRFAGRGGLSFSGTLDEQALILAVTPGQCSDGMSDRTYPYVAALRIGGEMRSGCAWTDATPGKKDSD